MAQVTVQEWDDFLTQHADVHILQTSAWGRLKSAFGWSTAYIIQNDCGAMILLRRLVAGVSLAYIPKGPVGEDPSQLTRALDAFCKKERVLFVKIEPDAWEGAIRGQTISDREKPSTTIQPRRTIVVNLEGGEEDWLSRMKQKTRYNIRLAEKKGVVVRSSQDWLAFENLLQATGKRDGFGVHDLAYYRKAYDLFHPTGLCELFMAYYDEIPLAAIMVFANGKRSWYFYGASSDESRNLMPTYLLQWEGMRWAAGKGCQIYDLWGIPDEPDEILESGFETRSDGLWGVYRFKRGFGGLSYRSAAAVDLVYNPILYKLYRALRGGQVPGGS